MPLRTHVVDYPPPQLAAQRRINAVLARAPRLRTDPWRVEAGQRLSLWLEAAQKRPAIAGQVVADLGQKAGIGQSV